MLLHMSSNSVDLWNDVVQGSHKREIGWACYNADDEGCSSLLENYHASATTKLRESNIPGWTDDQEAIVHSIIVETDFGREHSWPKDFDPVSYRVAYSAQAQTKLTPKVKNATAEGPELSANANEVKPMAPKVHTPEQLRGLLAHVSDVAHVTGPDTACWRARFHAEMGFGPYSPDFLRDRANEWMEATATSMAGDRVFAENQAKLTTKFMEALGAHPDLLKAVKSNGDANLAAMADVGSVGVATDPFFAKHFYFMHLVKEKVRTMEELVTEKKQRDEVKARGDAALARDKANQARLREKASTQG